MKPLVELTPSETTKSSTSFRMVITTIEPKHVADTEKHFSLVCNLITEGFVSQF